MIDELKAWVAEGKKRNYCNEIDRKVDVVINQLDGWPVDVVAWCYDYTVEFGVHLRSEEKLTPEEISRRIVESKEISERGISNGSI